MYPESRITKIGAFHFGNIDKSDPIRSLTDSLADASGNLEGALIVIPEAFNIREGYWSDHRYVDASIKTILKEISRCFKIALVAGLIEEGTLGSASSSAYLIDCELCEFLSRKTRDDGSRNYVPSPEVQDTAVLHRGVCLSALVCMDAANDFPGLSDRHHRLLKQMDALNPAPSVLCVPARMGTYGTKEVGESWSPYVTFALSNGTSSHPSILWPKDNESVAAIEKDLNAVRTVALV